MSNPFLAPRERPLSTHNTLNATGGSSAQKNYQTLRFGCTLEKRAGSAVQYFLFWWSWKRNTPFQLHWIETKTFQTKGLGTNIGAVQMPCTVGSITAPSRTFSISTKRPHSPPCGTVRRRDKLICDAIELNSFLTLMNYQSFMRLCWPMPATRPGLAPRWRPRRAAAAAAAAGFKFDSRQPTQSHKKSGRLIRPQSAAYKDWRWRKRIRVWCRGSAGYGHAGPG